MSSRWTTKNTRLFSGNDQIDNFRSMASIYPVRVVRRSSKPAPLAPGKLVALPPSFVHQGKPLDTQTFLSEVDTTGMLILKDDKLVYENYWLGNDATTQWISWSVGKSFVSALMGIAIGEGTIGSVEDPVTRYAPELAGSAYDNVRIKDVLQMSSGARWNEDYSDPNSDISRFGRQMIVGSSLDAFAASCTREHPPGTFNRYNSTDTHVLGLVVRSATHRSLSDYLRDKLWEPMGMEADAFWIVDNQGAEMASGGLNAVLRDYAKLGRLYLNNGAWNGVQIVPEDWVRASITPDAPHLMPGKRASASEERGYGYQWWVLDNNADYSAIGIYGQFIYVDPATRTVVAKTSAFRDYGRSTDAKHYRSAEHFALFRKIAAECG